MGSLKPGTVSFTGTDKVYQGTTWVREVNFGVDMTAFMGGLTRCQFKKSDGTVAFQTSDGTLSLTWISANTTLRLTIQASTSTALTGPISGGNFEVEAVAAGGSVERILTGAWEMDKELCTAAT